MNFLIRNTVVRKVVMLPLAVLIALCLMQTVNAQTLANRDHCLEAAKMKLEAQAFRDFLRPYAAGSQTFVGPSYKDHDSPKGDSLQEAMRAFVIACRSGGTPTCDAYASARDALYGGKPPEKSPSSPMHTNPISCEIIAEEYGTEYLVTEAGSAPAEEFDKTKWLYNFRHEQFHQTNCQTDNIGNTDTQDSPYRRKLSDPSGLALEEYEAYAVSRKVMETYLTESCNVASMASVGEGETIDLLFDRFPSRDILTMGGEVQAKAGIERPCMLRLNMTNTKTRESFALQMDSNGPIKPGDFQAVDAVAPEKAVGSFISGFSFGWGRDRVNYRAEHGILELTSFSPELLMGKVQVFGRLPKRTYGEAEPPWPPTMTVQTEFTLVPRVNMGTAISPENCFGGGE